MNNQRDLAREVAAGANCKDMDTALFYPAPAHGRNARTQDILSPEVEAACEACPVKKECLQLGLLQREQGVWGGVLLSKWARKKGQAVA